MSESSSRDAVEAVIAKWVARSRSAEGEQRTYVGNVLDDCVDDLRQVFPQRPTETTRYTHCHGCRDNCGNPNPDCPPPRSTETPQNPPKG